MRIGSPPWIVFASHWHCTNVANHYPHPLIPSTPAAMSGHMYLQHQSLKQATKVLPLASFARALTAPSILKMTVVRLHHCKISTHFAFCWLFLNSTHTYYRKCSVHRLHWCVKYTHTYYRKHSCAANAKICDLEVQPSLNSTYLIENEVRTGKRQHSRDNNCNYSNFKQTMLTLTNKTQ